MTSTLLQDGFEWLRGAVDANDLAQIRSLTAADDRPGARISPDHPLFAAVAQAPWMRPFVTDRPGLRPVRIVSFAKDEATNWGVPWHQDRVIAVEDRDDTAAVTNWSRKSGQWHCEPGEEVLRDMLFVRLHLDPHTAGNGAMQIAPGSHRQGLVPAAEAEALAERHPIVTCTAEPGDILVMSMLMLHRSGPAPVPSPRGVLRIDYADGPAPQGLTWPKAPYSSDLYHQCPTP